MIIKLVALLCISALVPNVAGQAGCNACGDMSLAKCTDDRSFIVCENNAETTSGGTCPEGTVCANAVGVCIQSSAGEAACPNDCDNCNPRGYACISRSQFALCFDPSTPSNVTGTCPQNTVCSASATGTSRCVAANLLPSCSRATPPPTTPAPTDQPEITPTPTTAPTDPTARCQAVGTVGRYPVDGTNCKSYISCIAFGTALVGQRYDCPGTTVFNRVSQLCVLSSLYVCPA